MTDQINDNPWPIPKFCFSVDFGNSMQAISFQEVSGLETETQIIEYRHIDSNQFSTIKMPGIAKVGNVTLKKGIFTDNSTFFEWYSKIKMNTIQRQTVVIKLLDEIGKPKMTWTLTNAFPVMVSGTDLKSDGNEIAVETIEVAHEGLVIANQ